MFHLARRRPPHPPGPTNYYRWIALTWRHLYKIARDPLGFPGRVSERYGDLCSFLLFTKRMTIVNHPRLLHEFLVQKRRDYIKARWQTRVMRRVLGNGLLMSEGELWLRQRRLLQQAFRADTMQRYADLTVQATLEHLRSWCDDAQVDLVAEMSALTMSLSIRSTVGLNPHAVEGPSPAELSAAIIEGADILRRDMENPLSPPDWAPLPSRRRKRQVVEVIDAYVNRAIAIRRADPREHQDLLALLLAEIDHEGDGRGMSNRQARDEVVTLMIAGSHASSATLGWFWKLVLARPEAHSRLVNEVDAVLGDREASLADLAQLRYTKQVLQETLRLYPAAWVMFCREAIRETTLGPYRVRRGSWVFAYPFVTHRDERFFPDPLRFDPERFSPERIDEIPAGAYFPFGHGPRVCIGQHLAMTQLTLMAATMLQRRRLTPTRGCEDLTIRRELSIRPATPCRVIASARSQRRCDGGVEKSEAASGAGAGS